MRQTYFISILLFCGINLFGQNEKLIDLIITSLKIYELNPIHLEESQRTNKNFKDFFVDSKDNFGTNIMEQLDLLYNSGYSEFEDNVDMRRIKMKQCLSLASVAVLSDKERFEFFLNLAQHCIEDPTGKSIKLLEEQNCGLVLLKIFLELKFNMNIQNDLNTLKTQLDYYKDSLSLAFYNDSKKLIEKYKK